MWARGSSRRRGPGYYRQGSSYLIISFVGGGAFAPCNTDAQAPRLPHDGECQLQTEWTWISEKTWEAQELAAARQVGWLLTTPYNSSLGSCADVGSEEKRGGAYDPRAGTTSVS